VTSSMLPTGASGIDLVRETAAAADAVGAPTAAAIILSLVESLPSIDTRSAGRSGAAAIITLFGRKIVVGLPSALGRKRHVSAALARLWRAAPASVHAWRGPESVLMVEHPRGADGKTIVSRRAY
jgi:hypothetical protein